MKPARIFRRLPAFDSIDEALQFCADNGITAPPVLLRCPSEVVVGSVEIEAKGDAA